MLRPHGFPEEVKKDGYVKVRVKEKIDFYFINLDLELASIESVRPLLEELELENKVLTTHPGGFEKLGMMELYGYKTVEGKEVDLYKTFDDAEDEVGWADVFINEFCEIVENLSSPSKEIWNKCHLKELDLGYQTGNTQKTFKTRIQPNTIKRCAELGASIMFTVYPHHNYDFITKEELEENKKKWVRIF